MIKTNDPDRAIREAAFKAVEKLACECNGRIPWDRIAEGFEYQSKNVKFASKALGIFKPKSMSGALSVKSVRPREGRKIWYRDQQTDPDFDFDSGLLSYNLAKNQPSSNKHLRISYERGTPIIYFRAIKPAVYEAIYPIWINRFDSYANRVLLAAPDVLRPTLSSMEAIQPVPDEVRESSWSSIISKRRNHQSWFSSV